MKRPSYAATVMSALLLCVALVSVATSQGTLTRGEVRKVDMSAKKITIKHGPMPKFQMEDGMTMVYAVQESSMLNAVKPGDKVEFDAEHVNGQFVVTKIQKAK